MAQHPFWRLAVPGVAGELLLTPCPGTIDNITYTQAVQELQYQDALAIVALITDEEIAQLNLTSYGEDTAELGVQWFHCPIEDDAAPDEQFLAKFDAIYPRLHTLLSQGFNVVLHCKGGSGRTGLIAALMLCRAGVAADDAIRQVQAVRPNAFKPAAHKPWLLAHI